jgi:hypothetical protein
MRIEREIQMELREADNPSRPAALPREQAGHKPATAMTVPSQKRP